MFIGSFLDSPLFEVLVPQGHHKEEYKDMDNVETLPFEIPSPTLGQDPKVPFMPEPPAAQPYPSSEEEVASVAKASPPKEKTPQSKRVPDPVTSPTLNQLLREQVECLF